MASYHGFSLFLITYGGLWRHVTEMHNFLLKSGHLAIAYHVSNMHKWNGGKDSKFNKCEHYLLKNSTLRNSRDPGI